MPSSMPNPTGFHPITMVERYTDSFIHINLRVCLIVAILTLIFPLTV